MFRSLSLIVIVLPLMLLNLLCAQTMNFQLDAASSVTYHAETRALFLKTLKITGTNTQVSGNMSWSDSDPLGSLVAGITINSTTFDSDNDRRDNHIREILKSDSFPEITFQLNYVEWDDAGEKSSVSNIKRANGILTVCGVSVEFDIPVDVSKESDRIVMAGSVDAKFTDFKIDPPTVAGVVSRARDEIRLEANLVWTGVENSNTNTE